jgi:hypothetical protein
LRYLGDGLRKWGIEHHIFHVGRIVSSEACRQEFFLAIKEADLLVLSFPLYSDNLPSACIRVMEILAENRTDLGPAGEPRFAAIANSGFPEAWQNSTALAICRKFASEVGFQWAGGLGLGGGGAIDGRPLEFFGQLLQHVGQSLELAAEELAKGNSIPPEAIKLMSRPIMPAWAYLCLGRLRSTRGAKRKGLWNLPEENYPS